MVNFKELAQEIYKLLLSYLDEETAMDLLEEIIDIIEDELE